MITIKKLCKVLIVVSILFLIDSITVKKAFSSNLSFTSKSYIQFDEDGLDENQTKFSEYMDLELYNLYENRVSFHVSGWFRANMINFDEDRREDEREKDELTYAYIKYKPVADKSLYFRLGRQYIFGGVASEHLDGIATGMDFTEYNGISLYGGFPVETEDDGRGADYLYGGRIFQRIDRKAELGVSYLKEVNRGSSFREEAGVDIWLMPTGYFEIQAQSFYNSLENAWIEHTCTVRSDALDTIVLTAFFSYIDYEGTFYGETTSAFSDLLMPDDEDSVRAGGSVEKSLFNDRLTVLFDYTNYSFHDSEDADYYGLKLRLNIWGARLGASVYRMDGETGRLKYIQSRAYAIKSYNKSDISLEVFSVNYDEPYNGLRTAYSFNSTMGYNITDNIRTEGYVDYSKTPDLSHNVKAIVKLIYNLDREI